mmetsp:Transcript_140552/g.437094  ORF Transcript_140552/g.437094 Transcript_140552/m.437094 type:complete len:90 (-) Transcript_140552:185-454(-)
MSAPIVPGIMCLASMGQLQQRASEASHTVSIDTQVDTVVVARCHKFFGNGTVGRYICNLRVDKVPAVGMGKEADWGFATAQGCGAVTGF